MYKGEKCVYMLEGNANADGEFIQLRDIDTTNVDFEVYYGEETLSNRDEMIEINANSVDKSVYEFNGNFPVFLVASFTADSLSNETGFSLTYLKAEKYDGTILVTTDEADTFIEENDIPIIVIALIFVFMIILSIILTCRYRTADQVEPDQETDVEEKPSV